MRIRREQMVPKPVGERAIEKVEDLNGARFPPAYRDIMRKKNGGLVRTGSAHWWIFPIPTRPAPFDPIMWMGAAPRDVVGFGRAVRNFPDFPKDLVPFGLRIYTRDVDGVLCFRRAPRSAVLGPEVRVWFWQGKPLRELLTDVAELWREDPFRTPRPKQDWKLKRVALDRSALRGAARADHRSASLTDLGWVTLGNLELSGNRLAVVDGARVPSGEEEGVVGLRPGQYTIHVSRFARRGECRVGGVKLLPPGAKVTRSRRLFDVDVNTGSVLLIDVDPLLRCEQRVVDRLAQRLVDVPAPRDVEAFAFGAASLLRVASGWGDGTYAVYALHDASGRVGVEARFPSRE